MYVDLPWYPRELSPNAREHWSVSARKKKEYKIACWALTKEAIGNPQLPDGKINLTIEFFPPSRRHYDLDNCLASIKSGLDGVALALGVNDRRFNPMPIMREEVRGLIRLTINEGKYDD